MYSPQYGPPPTYMPFEYKQAPYISTPPAGPGPYFSPKHSQVYSTPSREGLMAQHTRRTTVEQFSYASPPRQAAYSTPPSFAYAPMEDFALKYASPKRNDFVTVTERTRSKSRKKSYRAEPEIFIVDADDAYNYSPRGSPPPPYNESSQDRHWSSGYYTRERAVREEAEVAPRRGRSRTISGVKQHTSHKSSKASRQSPVQQVPLKATAQDAARAGIPAGYSYKNWDPSEEPIFLLGSVFDANSLGKWIYDWTVFQEGPSSRLADVAGELWLLLIQLAGKTKRAKECLPRIRRGENRDLVEDFIHSGERLWDRLIKILRVCEDSMWEAAKKEKSGKKSVSMGANSGRAFVNSIFGRGKKLEDTEDLMHTIRLWSWRFDDNCESILRRPAA